MNPYFSSLKPSSNRVLSARNAPAAEREAQLREFARELRVCVLNVIKGAGLGHVGGDFSAADTLVTLFGGVIQTMPMARPRIEDLLEGIRYIIDTQAEPRGGSVGPVEETHAKRALI